MGHSWGALGRSWVALGRSWGALGGLLGALGLLLAALGAILERHAKIIKKLMPKMTDLGSQKPPKMAPKSNPKATKNRCKKRSKKSIELRPPWGCLGAILGRSWPHLGVDFGEKTLENVGPRENPHFSKMRMFTRTYAFHCFFTKSTSR